MASESYMDSIKSQLVERAVRLEKTRKAAKMLHTLIGRHTVFPDDGSSQTISVYWNERNPDELVWFDLRNRQGEPVDQTYFNSIEEEERWITVRSANFVFSTQKIPPMVAFSIDLDHDRIRNNEGELLTPVEINGVIGDIGRYTTAIAAGRTD